MARRLIGTGITNSQGVAIMNKDAQGNPITGYTGVGAGRLQIVAESGTLQSETYELYDCMFYDDGVSTSGGKLYYTQETTVVSRTTDSTGTLVSNLSDSLQTIRVNKPSTSADEKDWSEPIHIEFDIVSYSGALSMQLWKSNTTGDYVGINIGQYLTDLTSANIKVEYDGSRVTLKVNDETVFNPSFQFANTGLFGIRLLLGANGNFKYTNFKVYAI